MDLSRGICILCTNNTKIIVPPQAEDTTSLLKDVLVNYINHEKFDEVNSSLKVCPMCLHDLLSVTDFRQNIKKGLSDDRNKCLLCYTEDHLVHVTEWTNFDNTLDNVKTEKRRARCSACLNCIKCLDVLDRIKTNLFKKYPHLEVSEKERNLKKSSTRTKNSRRNFQGGEQFQKTIVLSDEEDEYFSPSININVNNLKDALRHLKPLKNTKFNIDRFKEDKKLLKQVAFVNLTVSNFSTNDCKKLGRRSRTSEMSRKSINLSDTESSRDSPSPKQPFFKIRLKLKPNKIKSQRVALGKVIKPKTHQSKFLSEIKKELIVKIAKMNFDEITDFEQGYQENTEIRTPTKASRKMLATDSISSSKKRKSVTFADVLNTEITDGPSHKDKDDATPLKSLLKKSILPRSDLLKQDDEGSSDEIFKLRAEPIPDSDEELEAVKGYVDDILKNNDDIFDSLKTSKDTEVIPADVKNGCSNNIDSDSEDNEKQESSGKNTENMKKPLEVNKKKIEEINSSDSENEEGKTGSIEKECNENEKQEEVKSKDIEKNKKRKSSILGSNSDDDTEKHKSVDDGTISDISNEEEGIAKVIEEEEENKLDDGNKSENDEKVISIDKSQMNTKISEKSNASNLKADEKKKNYSHKKAEKQKRKKRRSNSNSDSDPEEKIPKKDSASRDFSENEIVVTKNRKNAKSDVEHENEDHATSEPSTDTRYEEIKGKNGQNIPDDNINNGNKNIDDSEEVNEVSPSAIIIDNTEIDKVDKKIPNNEREDENNQTVDKHGVDIGSDSEKNSKSSSDSSNLRSKSKKRRNVGRQEEDEDLKNSRDDEECEEPETKREKVSDRDDLSKTDSKKNINAKQTKNEDVSFGVQEKRKHVDPVDNKIDELIAKYTNPSIPNLNNDNNVSDSENVGASGKDQEEEEAVDVDTNVNEVIAEESNVDKSVKILVENISESDITMNSDAPDKNVTLKELNLDNIIENFVDSC